MKVDSKYEISNPTYKQVCSGKSGHVEVLYVELVNPQMHFEDLVRFFFSFHDPTETNRQGADHGPQYASYIFCSDSEQLHLSKMVRDELQERLDSGMVRCFRRRRVETKISMMSIFTEASSWHQEYLVRNPNGYW